jgi:hypothetical protein
LSEAVAQPPVGGGEKQMLEAVWEPLQILLGVGRDVGDAGVAQIALRTILVYAFTLTIVRLGSKRFLSKATAFDVIRTGEIRR